MPVAKPGIWVVTILIILMGIVLLLAVNRSDRARVRDMSRIGLGAPVSTVDEAIETTPTRCPVGPLGYLRASFPEGWTEAAIDVALEQLEAQTSERRVYPLNGGDPVSCTGDAGRTEVGVAADGTILWTVAVLGLTRIELPPALTPAGIGATGERPN